MPSPKELLQRFGLTPKYSFGQNFLSDAGTAERIAGLSIAPVAGQRPGTVLELGAGLGALTTHLLAGAERVIAVERDRDLVPALSEIHADEIAAGRLIVREADAKAIDWEAEFTGPGPLVLCGNLPYQITGPLLEKTCGLHAPIARAVFLVQKEVADRLAATPGSDSYGALTVFVQARFAVKRAFVVGSGSFYPAPRVSSAVVVLVPHVERVSEETPAFRRVVHAAFHARRKTLRNAWKGLASADWLERVSSELGVSLDARGETLDVATFAAVARLLENHEAA
ncbi:MAG TPA: 16S rRNA (adenine(1518)-N(6)/adenine(1519)-N(6))-dimethyltransferase RsmA [Polyangiaceae bacterium]|nr:16S rRNA (adenine(1518)-N(6)/adenine(1519)-N(6))-dimethyltransferase RsmA [Polyangiaceae bacterium]